MAGKGRKSGARVASRLHAVPSKGRPRHASAGTRDGRIDVIVRMMVERRWFGGRSHQELAKEWGVHPRTVCDLAIAAGAVVDRLGTPIEEFVREKLLELETIERRAMARTKVVKVVCKECGAGYEFTHPDPDTRAAADAVRLQLQARGALIQRVQAKVETVSPELAAMSKPELAAWLAEQLVERELPLVVAALAKRGITIVEPAVPALPPKEDPCPSE